MGNNSKNNQEEISYNDFENDLNKAYNLPKDEVDRAISIMIHQAEVNPNIIGEYKGGTFIISHSFVNAVTSTIKYENKFITGKVEYDNNNKTAKDDLLSALIITPPLLSRMLDNFDNLNNNEISEIAGQLYKLM